MSGFMTNCYSFLVLCTNYLWLSSARLAASHYEALIWETRYVYQYPSRTQFIKTEIEGVIVSMTENVKELITQGLACHLPISV